MDVGEECDDANGVDTDNCRNNCTIPRCGDQIIDLTHGESCDPPGSAAGGNGNLCRDNCTVCGDGIMNPGEECDDGNGVDTDNCRNNCTTPRCGDQIIDLTHGESCDPPGSAAGGNGNLCRDNCTVCGDGIMDVGEECDDANAARSDNCTNNCTSPRCGDQIIDLTHGESCDPPGSAAAGNRNLCRANCTVCGDGIMDVGEECDDANGVDTDNCRNNCTISRCGDQIIDLTHGESCDPPGSPAGGNHNLCRENCTVCGDGITDAGEQCDDGNGVYADNCRNDCTIPGCGDQIIDVMHGESCDTPTRRSADLGNLCRDNCTVCGDGIMDVGEECYDANG